MKKLFALLLSLFLGGALQAASPEEEKAFIEKERPLYPLKTCVVSGESLEDGAMGAPVDYVYREDGKPDRLVRFCCKSCIKSLNKNPAKFLVKLDEAKK